MKVLYLDCEKGVAGDMLMSALLDLFEEKDDFIKKMNQLLPNTEILMKRVEREDVSGIYLDVLIEGRSESCQNVSGENSVDWGALKSEIVTCLENSEKEDMIDLMMHLNVSKEVKLRAIDIYHELKMAESIVHGREMQYIHNSRLGSLDAVMDIVGICLLIEALAPDKILATPLNLGNGTVKCGTRTFSVPAPATALLVKDMPTYKSEIQGELCTPTGAAAIKYLVDQFGEMPLGAHIKWGYGIGGKVYEVATYTRACLVSMG